MLINNAFTFRVPKDEKKVETATFRLGFFLGLSTILLVIILYTIATSPASIFPHFAAVMITYRFLAMTVLLVWGWYLFLLNNPRGLDMLVWKRFRVNYPFIFEVSLYFSFLKIFSTTNE